MNSKILAVRTTLEIFSHRKLIWKRKKNQVAINGVPKLHVLTRASQAYRRKFFNEP